MITIDIDGETYQANDMSIEQLDYVIERLRKELEGKRLLRDAESESKKLAIRFLAARDGVMRPGDEPPLWVQPQGSFDSYPVDYQVIYDGKVWRNITPFNVWAPPTGWREVVEGTPQWVQPTGAHDAYNIGDRVMFQGFEFISKINANVYSPFDYPPGWEVYPIPDPPEDEVDLPEEPEPDPEDPPVEPEPEPPVDPEDPEADIPTWSPTATYAVGDLVIYENHIYKCLAAHGEEYQGTWKPGVAHAAWQNMGPV